MILANSIILIDQTAVPLALPAVISDFDIGTQGAQWVLNTSLLALSGFLVLGGRLGDQYGRRRIFLIGAIGFAVSSTVAGLSPTFATLLAARVVQGLGGALMLPCSVAIVSATFPSDERGKALGTMGGVAAIAGALGPTIGGALTSAASWRFVLLVNLPLAGACVLATLIAVPKDRDGRRAGSVDFVGAGFLCVAVVGLVFGLSETQAHSFISPLVLAPVVLAIGSGLAFLWWEQRVHDPLMNITMFRRTPNYLGATIAQGLAGLVEMGLGLIFPLLLILDLGMSPLLAGIALIPTTVPMIVLSTSVGKWYDRSGGRPPLVVGFGILAVSAIALAVGVHTLQPTGRDYFVLLPGLASVRHRARPRAGRQRPGKSGLGQRHARRGGHRRVGHGRAGRRRDRHRGALRRLPHGLRPSAPRPHPQRFSEWTHPRARNAAQFRSAVRRADRPLPRSLRSGIGAVPRAGVRRLEVGLRRCLPGCAGAIGRGCGDVVRVGPQAATARRRMRR